jgi:hypothetical protein
MTANEDKEAEDTQVDFSYSSPRPLQGTCFQHIVFQLYIVEGQGEYEHERSPQYLTPMLFSRFFDTARNEHIPRK